MNNTEKQEIEVGSTVKFMLNDDATEPMTGNLVGVFQAMFPETPYQVRVKFDEGHSRVYWVANVETPENFDKLVEQFTGKYSGTIGVGLSGCNREFEFEIAAEDIQGFSEDVAEEYVNDVARDFAFSSLDWGYSKNDT